MRRYYWYLLVLLSLISAFAFQGSRGLYESTEGRYAECAREMVESGNYLAPTLNYLPHWTKPPMTYWAIAAGMKILGVNEWGVRVYDSIAFLLTVAVIGFIGATLWGRTAGFIASLIYVSAPYVFFCTDAVSTDTLLTLWTTLAVGCYLRAQFGPSSVHKKIWISGMWLAFGLAFMTKGPPGLLPLAPILIWHYQNRGTRKAPVFTIAGLALFLIVGISWYAVVMSKYPGLFHYFWAEEVVDRNMSDKFNRNPQWYKPFIIYIPILLFGIGPWCIFTFQLIYKRALYIPRNIWDVIRKGELGQQRGLGGFFLLWLIVPLIVFFLSKSRLPLYMLPLIAPIVLASSRQVMMQMEKSANSMLFFKRVVLVAVVTTIVLAGAKGSVSAALLGRGSDKDMKELYNFCRSASDLSSTQYVAYNNSMLNGLQFYLNGKLIHASSSKILAPDEISLKAIVDDIKAKPGKAYVFIINDSRAKKLARKLDKLGIEYELNNGKDSGAYSLFIVKSIANPSNGEAASPAK